MLYIWWWSQDKSPNVRSDSQKMSLQTHLVTHGQQDAPYYEITQSWWHMLLGYKQDALKETSAFPFLEINYSI